MTLNLIGPLVANPAWMCGLLNTMIALDGPITSIGSVSIEYFSPKPSEGLGDRTTADVLIHAWRESVPIVIVVETKLGDRFNSRQVAISDKYLQVAQLWKSLDTPSRKLTSQLARVHALAEHVVRADYGPGYPARLLLVHHQDDPQANPISDAYRAALTDASIFRSASLAEFFRAMTVTAPGEAERRLVEALARRYADLSQSQAVWDEFLATFSSRERSLG